MKSTHGHTAISPDRLKPIALQMRLAIAAVLLGGVQSAIAADSDAASELDEVVVTAQKREQSVLDVPMSISAMSAEKLDSSNVKAFNDLGKLATGVVVEGPVDGLGSTIRIRGIGTQKYILGIMPSVGVFVDDIPLARLDAAFTNFSDIDRVEVLKGPQATLLGKQVSAGAIVIHTKKPHTREVDGNLEFNLGNFGLQEYRGAINLPMGDATAARFSGYWTTKDSEIENIVTGKQGETETKGARLRLLREVSDDVEAILTLERHEAKVRNMLNERLAYGSYTLSHAAASGVTLLEPNLFDRKGQADAGEGRSHTITNAALHLSWDISDAWSFASATGYQQYDRDTDQSGRPGGVSDRSEGLFGVFTYVDYSDDKSLTQELRLAYEGDSLSSVIGVYYGDTKVKSLTDILLKITPSFSFPLYVYQDRRAEDRAVFLHNIYRFNDQWELTAGLRYAEVEKEEYADSVNGAGRFGSGPIPPVAPQTGTWSSVSGTLKLSYKVNEDLRIYGGYDRGFKPGGHNYVSMSLPSFDEEIADHYEIGVKGVSFDRRLRWSTSLFDLEYKDFQVNVPSMVTGVGSILQNAASVEVSGIEAEATWMVNENFSLDGAVAYINSEYGDYRNAECTDLQRSVTPRGSVCTQDLSGRDVHDHRPLTWNLGAQYESGLGSTNLSWHLRAEVVYRDSTNGIPTLDERTILDEHTLVNASVGLSSADDVWHVSLWGKNLADKDYVASYDLTRDGAFGILGYLGESRAYGVNLKYSF